MALSWLQVATPNLLPKALLQAVNGLTLHRQVFMPMNIAVYMCFSGTQTVITKADLSLIHAHQAKALSVLAHGSFQVIGILSRTRYG